ncbi:sigma-70 family RNA polymerase sigma factor [Rhizobium sp. RU36D]|uniref:sigma-70 family RNA polymerase sigma factor n=1 Tax=Rhizobium sp. RU36D TaxID=1907415 RepID=UPI0009D8A0B2|nr:sigma-70 family RNA polymerase sigma factor [Rhizobium sp. RU36D]SMD13740.1 RNA polymerase sigma-70 factor, ECF subfamily [Rhizobium sp. RU36D]
MLPGAIKPAWPCLQRPAGMLERLMLARTLTEKRTRARLQDEETCLLEAFAAGDDRAAQRLIERSSPRVLSQALRLLGNRSEAEDITQEAMLRLWRAAPTWETRAKVSTWLYRVTANLCLDRLRARRHSVPIDGVSGEIGATDPTIIARLQQEARLNALRRALAELPERQALAVSLRFLEGLGNPEIAAIMGIGVEAVESLTARGKRALSSALSSQKEALGYADE